MSPRLALDCSLAALAFFAPLSIAGTNISLVLATLAAGWAWSDHSMRPEVRRVATEAVRSPVFILLAASFAWFLVAALAGVDPERSLHVIPKEAHKLWAFTALAIMLGTARRDPAWAGLAAGLGAHALIGISQTLAGEPRSQYLIRASGFIHPVSYGNILGLGFICVTGRLLRPAADASRRTAITLAAVLGAALLFNQTRAVLVALVTAAAAGAIAAPAVRRRFILVLLVLITVAAIWEVMPTGGRNIRTLLSHDPQAAGHRTRFILWEVAWQMAREKPITGEGPGQFRDAFQRLRPGRLDAEGSWGSAHNLFLHQLAERGVPGLLLLLTLFAAFLRESWCAARRRADTAGLCALAATAAFLVMNLTEAAWQTEQVATFFLLLWLWGAGPRPHGEVL